MLSHVDHIWVVIMKLLSLHSEKSLFFNTNKQLVTQLLCGSSCCLGVYGYWGLHAMMFYVITIVLSHAVM